MFWGITPALDLLDVYLQENCTLPEEINILLVGGSDARHILQTLARRYRHPPTKLNFVVVEASVETIARQLLLLNTALQDPSVMGLVPKVKIFMELYGNTLVRPSAAKYLTNTATHLVKMVTDYDYLTQVLPSVSIDIKYKERDYLENLIKFWCGKDDFDICASWDGRLRKHLGVRYDSKLGAFDWDLHMRLHMVGAKPICSQEYRNFRLNGVAFAWLESEVSRPNRSMVCVVVPNGESFLHYGYLGDMQTGPFVAYGLECEDAEFIKSANDQNMHRATDVTERNLCQIFHEIRHGREYVHKSTSDMKLGTAVLNTGEKRVIDIRSSTSRGTTVKNTCLKLENVKIKFVSLSVLTLMKHKREYQDFFHLIYYGCFYVKHLSKDLLNHIAKTGALILVENQKFIVTHRDKQLQEFGEEIRKSLEGIKVEEKDFDPCKDNYAKFVKV